MCRLSDVCLRHLGNTDLARTYGVRVPPTVILYTEVKIEGRPDIPFVCSEDTYTQFKKLYPMIR